MSSFKDTYHYEDYHLYLDEDYEGPPIIHKRSRLLVAVVQNEVGVLEDLLDSPEWYTVTDKYGSSLLEVAILTENKAVFNYLLSIPDFPIDFVNQDGQTALVVALDGFVSNDIWMSQDFAYELINKGASVDVVCFEGNQPLHRALDRSYNRVATLLIEKGADVNVPDSEGSTPLELAVGMSKGVAEVVSALLIHGATPSVHIFEDAVRNHSTFLIQEMLFYYVFDEYSEFEISLNVIIKLVDLKSPLLGELYKCRFKVRIEDKSEPYFRILYKMNFDSLKTLIEKFGNIIRKALGNWSNWWFHSDTFIFLDNIDFMLQNGFRDEVLLCISTLESFDIFDHLLHIGITESSITEQYCYLLSYGLTVSESDLQLIYRNYGYCELFKIMLHMDIKVGVKGPKWIMPTLIYDVATDLDTFFLHSDEYSRTSIKELCGYFVHPQLKVLTASGSPSEVSNLPEIPLLVELARNAFRKYCVKLFRIETSRKFYSLLTSLPITVTHKKIISYETKLY